MPEIIQYFVKGELQPRTTTYIVPIGEPTHHEGRSANLAYDYAPPSQQCKQQDGYYQPHRNHNDVGMKAEATQEHFAGAPSGASSGQPQDQESRPKPPAMEPIWDAQR